MTLMRLRKDFFLKGKASRVQIDIQQWFALPQTISPEDLMGVVSSEESLF